MKLILFLIISIFSASEIFLDPISLEKNEDGSEFFPYKSVYPILSLANMKDMTINIKNPIILDMVLSFEEMDSLIIRQKY